MTFEQEVLASMPALRRMAMSLSKSPGEADDLMQEALLRAFTFRDKYTPGTNMTGWLTTIAKHHFYGCWRRKKWEIEDVDGEFSANLVDHHAPNPEAREDLRRVMAALEQLGPEAKALMLDAAEGVAYEDMAEKYGLNIGTVKSRISRARTKLLRRLEHA